VSGLRLPVCRDARADAGLVTRSYKYLTDLEHMFEDMRKPALPG
jgi:hypothetical protein